MNELDLCQVKYVYRKIWVSLNGPLWTNIPLVGFSNELPPLWSNMGVLTELIFKKISTTIKY